MTAEQIADVEGDYATSILLDERDKTVIAWAEQVTLGQAAAHPESGEALKRFFTAAQIVELTYAIGLFMMNNRVHDALGLELEEEALVSRIHSTGRIDRAAFRDFLGRIPRWTEPPPGS